MNKDDGSQNHSRILRKSEVLQRIAVSDTTLWRLERRGEFPRHIQISPRAVGWLESDIEQWISQKARGVDDAVETRAPRRPRRRR